MPARIDVLLRELMVTLRGLRRDRTFTVASVALLALGIGLTSAVVSLLWRVTYAQLPVPDPAHIYMLSTNVTHVGQSESDGSGGPRAVFSRSTYRYLTAHLEVRGTGCSVHAQKMLGTK